MQMTSPDDFTPYAHLADELIEQATEDQRVDGRKEVEAHGSREMPVWGREFRSTVPHIKELGMAVFGPQIAHARIASVIDISTSRVHASSCR